MKAYEIHTFKDGKWHIDSLFDDRSIALSEAERMDQSGRYLRLRVVEEIYDESAHKATQKTIYRGAKYMQEQADRIDQAKKTRFQPRGGNDEDHVPLRVRGAAAVKKKPGSMLGVVVVFALLGMVALALLIGLRTVENLL
jgi:hypothetical protein